MKKLSELEQQLESIFQQEGLTTNMYVLSLQGPTLIPTSTLSDYLKTNYNFKKQVEEVVKII